MTRRVILSPKALADLDELYDYIADRAGAVRADGYVTRITNTCEKLGTFAERGKRRDDLRPGLRVMGFERRASIVFHIEPSNVIIDRVLYGGRDLDRAFPHHGDDAGDE